MKHLLKLMDLSREEILSILNLADQLKYERKNGVIGEYLKGKKLGTNSADTHCFYRTAIFKSDAASRLKILRAYFPAISTVL